MKKPPIIIDRKYPPHDAVCGGYFSLSKYSVSYAFVKKKDETEWHPLRGCDYEWAPLSQAPKPCELLNDEGISRSAERDQRLCPIFACKYMTPQAFEKA